nr:endoplasmic reticulum protein [Cryptococcus tetragattii IND107]
MPHQSIFEVILLCVAGYVLARAGVTDKATQRKLNVINVSLFTPALLFSKVAYSLTPAKLKELWIIPLGFVLISGLSALVAWLLAKVFRLSRSQTAFAICASMFQNSNSLPIALIQALVTTVPGLKWGSDDSKDQMLGRALTYLVLYSTLGMMLRWSWGVKLLSNADDEVDRTQHGHGVVGHIGLVQSPGHIEENGHDGRSPFFPSEDDQGSWRRDSSLGVTPTMIRDPSSSPTTPFVVPGSAHSMHPPRRQSTTGVSMRSHSVTSATRRPRHLSRTESGREFWGLPEAPRHHGIELIEEDSSDEEEEDEEWGNYAQPNLRLRRSPPSTKFQAYWRGFQKKAASVGKSLNAFMTVPMYAALLSIFIAMVQPLQREMAKFKPLEQAIKGAGQCSIPVTLVVLGAFFYSPPPAHPPFSGLHLGDTPARPSNFFERKFRAIAGLQPSDHKAYPRENRTVFVAVISRMIIVPMLMMPLLALMAKYDFFEAAADPVFVLCAVLLVSSPPALTLAQITQAASGDAFERLISKTISWSYAVLTPPLTLIYVVIGLVFGRL